MTEELFQVNDDAVAEFRSLMQQPEARAAFVELKADAATKRRYDHVLRLVGSSPWAIRPEMLGVIVDVVAFHVRGGRFGTEEMAQRIGAARQVTAQPAGVAVIPLHGVIIPKAGGFQEMSGGTSIDRFRAMFREAMASPDVGSIIFDVDSPGGMVDQVPEMGAELRSARGQKPMIAVANTEAASAAYWLASQADELVVSPSARVGSIGVLTAHEDQSVADQQDGIKTTLVSAGKYKTEGNPFEPLTEDARAYLQSLVDEYYGMFVSAVARGRGVNVADVRSGFGEGRMVGARNAVSLGMADRQGTLGDVISEQVQKVRTRSRPAAVGYQTITVGAGESATLTLTDGTVVATAIPVHHTETYDDPWDGPANKARLQSGDEKNLRAAFAWYDSNGADPNGDGYPDAKSDYAFIHHTVDADGTAGSANTQACSSAIAVLNGGRGVDEQNQRWSGDRVGIHRHLAAHLEDSGVSPADIPPLSMALVSLQDPETWSSAEFHEPEVVPEESVDADILAELADLKAGL